MKKRRGLYTNLKAQSTIELVAVLGVAVAALLLMQFYVARGMRGQLQTSGDQLSGHDEGIGMYAYGLTKSSEAKDSSRCMVEWSLPGWNHPTTIIAIRDGREQQSEERALKPLSETEPYYKGK